MYREQHDSFEFTIIPHQRKWNYKAIKRRQQFCYRLLWFYRMTDNLGTGWPLLEIISQTDLPAVVAAFGLADNLVRHCRNSRGPRHIGSLATSNVVVG